MGSKSLFGILPKIHRSKFGAKKVTSTTGEVFDSKLEYNRWTFLTMLQKEGKISNLRRQVRFIVIPAQYIEVARTGKNGRPLTPMMKLVEHDCHYTADFVYEFNGREIIEDTKGFKTQDYIIRRKLMRQQGHPITEITKAAQVIC